MEFPYIKREDLKIPKRNSGILHERPVSIIYIINSIVLYWNYKIKRWIYLYNLFLRIYVPTIRLTKLYKMILASLIQLFCFYWRHFTASNFSVMHMSISKTYFDCTVHQLWCIVRHYVYQIGSSQKKYILFIEKEKQLLLSLSNWLTLKCFRLWYYDEGSKQVPQFLEPNSSKSYDFAIYIISNRPLGVVE